MRVRTHFPMAVALCAVLAATAHAQMLRVLVTNDDGIGAPGIAALVDQLTLNPNLHVDVVAPATNQSGGSDNYSTNAFGVAAGTTATGYPGTAVSGTPADSVLYAIYTGLPQPPDVVVSGINFGQNIGRYTVEDLSGTVGAAMTAARIGIPAIAVSAGLSAPDYGPAARYVANVVEKLRTNKAFAKKMVSKTGLDQRLALNVNFPTCTTGAIRGVTVVPLANAQDVLGRVVTGYTMTAPNTFKAVLSSTNALASNCTSTLADPTTDVEAMTNGFASVTPLNPTITPDSKWKKFKFLAKIPFN